MNKSDRRKHSHSSLVKNRTISGRTDGLWIWGHHPVSAALANGRRRIFRLVATSSAVSRLGATIKNTDILPAHMIDRLLPPGAVHQGVATLVQPLPTPGLPTLIDQGIRRIVILDQISDPHNLGAVFRSAAAFGFGGLILQTRNTPQITGTVAKAAAGAIETVTECRVVNIARTLKTLDEAGYHTVGLATRSNNMIDTALSGANHLAIILGAEDKPLRPAVATACATLARIPLAAGMESLNVSNAAAIAFHLAYRSNTDPDAK